jgi:hypothetical protein
MLRLLKTYKLRGLVRQRTIPNEQPPLVGEVNANLVVVVPDYRSKGPGFNSLRYQIFWEVVGLEPVTVAERSKACTLFARSEAGTMCSNPTQGMDV